MVLEAASDIRGAERDLREIEILKSRQVEGSGELERESFLFFFLSLVVMSLGAVGLFNLTFDLFLIYMFNPAGKINDRPKIGVVADHKEC